MGVFFLGTVGRTQYVEIKTHTRGQHNHLYYPKIGGSVARMLATVAHVNSLMDMTNQWSLSVVASVSKIWPRCTRRGGQTREKNKTPIRDSKSHFYRQMSLVVSGRGFGHDLSESVLSMGDSRDKRLRLRQWIIDSHSVVLELHLF